nr:MAG TPA: hypothetical protein [Bacteriophage sp.]
MYFERLPCILSGFTTSFTEYSCQNRQEQFYHPLVIFSFVLKGYITF